MESERFLEMVYFSVNSRKICQWLAWYRKEYNNFSLNPVAFPLSLVTLT